MGVCKYCNNPAGFFKSKHPECEKKYNEGRQQIINIIIKAIQGAEDINNLNNKISTIRNNSYIPDSEEKALLIIGWENAVKHFLEDGLLDKSEESKLAEFQEHFGLSQEDLNINGAYTKIAKASVLRDLMDGIIPERVQITGNLPINLQKAEKIIWVFSDTNYLEEKIKRTYSGSSHGLGIRISKGIYYRPAVFRAEPKEYIQRVPIDRGLFVITNKHIYFAGNHKSFRIPYPKIVSFQPYSDGIGIIRDAASAKPQIFVTGDGWFTYNLVINLSKL